MLALGFDLLRGGREHVVRGRAEGAAASDEVLVHAYFRHLWVLLDHFGYSLGFLRVGLLEHWARSCHALTRTITQRINEDTIGI